MRGDNKPKLRPELESNFGEIDKRSAECYLALEKISLSLAYLAKTMCSLKTGAVQLEITDNDSLVHHAATLFQNLHKRGA